MTTFTPLSAAIGGALIGLAAVLLMLLTGRLAGISGILGGLLSGSSDRPWRVAFILGLILAPIAGTLAGYPLSAPAMPASWGIVIAAGLLVGFGTRLASGCTSGHGVCGIARLSTRSIVATAVFMGAAIVVVALTRHVFGG
jgi:uncharacterized membrane protein YedE/YeeE